MRTRQRDGRAGSASGRTSMRKLWPTSTALMSKHFSSFTALPTPLSQRLRVVPQCLLPPHRSTPQSTPWIPSTAPSWPVTTQCLAHRCRSAQVLLQINNFGTTIYWFILHVTIHACAMCSNIEIDAIQLARNNQAHSNTLYKPFYWVIGKNQRLEVSFLLNNVVIMP